MHPSATTKAQIRPSYARLKLGATLALLAAACSAGPDGAPGDVAGSANGTPSTLPRHRNIDPTQPVGNGNDWVVQVGSSTIASSRGSFPSVAGLSSSSTAYSLQLNTNLFPNSSGDITPCNQADAIPGNCVAWEQFVYDPGTGALLIEYWLYSNDTLNCPGSFSNGAPAFGFTNACVTDSTHFSAPAEPLSALPSMVLTATSTSAGDQVTLTVGGSTTSIPVQSSLLNLSKHWNQAEFNVFGENNRQQINLGSGTSIEVQNLVTTATPTRNAPSCVANGTTGETNNLNPLGGCCPFGGDRPGIQFFESGVAGVSPPTCPALLVSPVPLGIPANSGGQGTATVVMTAQPVDTTVSLWPTTCTISGPLSGTVTPYFGALNATFTLPPSATPGQTFPETITCANGLSASELVEVTAPSFYPYPTDTALEDGTCVTIPLVWSDTRQTNCSGVTYTLTPGTLPAGVTADIVASGIEIGGGFSEEDLAVCAGGVPLTDTQSFNFSVTSNGCFGGPYVATGTVSLVPPPPPPPCVPATCKANSCQGTISDGCGGILNCASTCTSPQVCSAGACVTPTPTCPLHEAYCAVTGECMTPLACERASGGTGSGGGCKPGTCM